VMRAVTLKAAGDAVAQLIGYYAGLARDQQRRDGAARGPVDYYLDPPLAVGRTSQPFSSAKRSTCSTSFFGCLARLGVTPASVASRVHRRSPKPWCLWASRARWSAALAP
jgi:hypothetical protein